MHSPSRQVRSICYLPSPMQLFVERQAVERIVTMQSMWEGVCSLCLNLLSESFRVVAVRTEQLLQF